MIFEEKAEVVISQLRTDRDRLQNIVEQIRAEIEALEDGISSYHNDRPWIYKDEALAIIDKYKKEKEVKDGSN